MKYEPNNCQFDGSQAKNCESGSIAQCLGTVECHRGLKDNGQQDTSSDYIVVVQKIEYWFPVLEHQHT